MRETRDLLRRRTFLVRQRAGLLTHLQILNAQYNLPPFPKKLSFAANRAEIDIPGRFAEASVQRSAADLALIDCLDEQIAALELYLSRTAKVDDLQTYHRLRTIPGLRWAFAEAACLFLRGSERARRWKEKQQKKRGEGKALAILAARLARAVYHLWRKAEAFDEERFWGSRQPPSAGKGKTGSSSLSGAEEASHAAC
jgi:hypothetical protein